MCVFFSIYFMSGFVSSDFISLGTNSAEADLKDITSNMALVSKMLIAKRADTLSVAWLKPLINGRLQNSLWLQSCNTDWQRK